MGNGSAILQFNNISQAKKFTKLVASGKYLSGRGTAKLIPPEPKKIKNQDQTQVSPQKKKEKISSPPQCKFQTIPNDSEPEPIDISLSQILSCSICTEIILLPRRIECGHYFCNECITAWLQVNSSCPLCRKEVSQISIVEDFLVSAIVEGMKFRCPNRNAFELCPWTGTRGQLQTHWETCELQMVVCITNGSRCSWKGTKGESKQHYSECKCFLILCNNERRGCTWQGNPDQMENHLISCPFEVIFCVNRKLGCPMGNQRALYPDYHDKNCLYRSVSCKLGCNWIGLQKQFERHAEKECPNREVYCENFELGCKAPMAAKKLATHQKDCPFTIYYCNNHKLGCTWQGTCRAFTTHNCGFKKVICEFNEDGCEWQGIRNDYHNHKTNNCLYRKVYCGNFKLGCRDPMTVKNLAAHKKDCPFTTISCNNRALGCTWQGFRRALATHNCDFEHVICEHKKLGCEWQGFRSSYYNHKTINCPYRKVFCDNLPWGCQQSVRADRLSEHLQICRHTPVLCKYHNIGCFWRGRRDFIESYKRHERNCKFNVDNAHAVNTVCSKTQKPTDCCIF